MADPTGPGGPEDADDVRFDRDAIPELRGFFDGLDTLAGPPAGPEVRLDHIARASSIAAGRWQAGDRPGVAPSWRSIGWRVATVAAGLVVVTVGLGADDSLPAPAQRLVSAIADQIGIELPDGEPEADGGSPGGSTPDRGSSARTGPGAGNPGDPDRNTPGPQPLDETDDDTGAGDTPPEASDPAPPTTTTPRQNPRATPGSPATPAAPATPGDPGVPADRATPAEPATPAQPERPAKRPLAPTRPTVPEQRNEPQGPSQPETSVQPEPADKSENTDAKSPAKP